MVAQLYRHIVGTGVLVLVVAACQPAAGPAGPAAPLESGVAFTLTAAQQTISAQETLLAPQPIVQESTSTPGLPDSFPTATEFFPTATSTVVFIPTETPTATYTPSPAVPVAHITTTANCRRGPGRAYDIVTVVEVGQVHVVTGRYGNTYVILQPGGGPPCWLSTEFAVIEGNLFAVGEYAPPPTPTPQVGWIEGIVRVKNLQRNIITVAGIEVVVTPGDFHTQTDGSGYYRILDVPAGEVTIEFKHPNYSIQSLLNVVIRAGQRTSASPPTGEPVVPHLRPTACRDRFGLPCLMPSDGPSEVFEGP